MKRISEELFKQLIFDVVAEHMLDIPEDAANKLLGIINNYTTLRPWHIMADGDLPEDYQVCYITTEDYDVCLARYADVHTKTYNGMFEGMGDSSEILYSGDEVLAWTPFELPGPWEGGRNDGKTMEL